MSPSSTEDSDAIPGTERKGQREVTSAQPKVSKRHLIFCKPPLHQQRKNSLMLDKADVLF